VENAASNATSIDRPIPCHSEPGRRPGEESAFPAFPTFRDAPSLTFIGNAFVESLSAQTHRRSKRQSSRGERRLTKAMPAESPGTLWGNMVIILGSMLECIPQGLPVPKAKKSRPKHVRWVSEDTVASAKPGGELHNSLLEAYRKHSAELGSLEDRLNKTVLLILGLFGAGLTAVSAVSLKREKAAALCFILIVLGVGWVGVHATREANDLRKAVRDLLVRCVLAMGFYEPGNSCRVSHYMTGQNVNILIRV
jgi:hypothetical protein